MSFETVFVMHSSCGLAKLHKKLKKAGDFVRLLDRVAQRKRPKSPYNFYASYCNHFYRSNSQNIWPHSFRKSSWSNAFYYLIHTFENCSRTDFGFRHMIRTGMPRTQSEETFFPAPLPYPRAVFCGRLWQAGEQSCLPFYFLCIVTQGRMKNARQKPSQNTSKWKEIPQFTQGKKNTFILSSLLCILKTICQKIKQFWW